MTKGSSFRCPNCTAIAWLMCFLFSVGFSQDESRCSGAFYSPFLIPPCVVPPIRKFYYHVESVTCREFDFKNCTPGGIGNIKNKFNSMEECMNICISPLMSSMLVQSSSVIIGSSSSTQITGSSSLITVKNVPSSLHIEIPSSQSLSLVSSSFVSYLSTSNTHNQPPRVTSLISSTQGTSTSSFSSSSIFIYHSTPKSTSKSNGSYDHFFIYGSASVLLVVLFSIVIAGSVLLIMYRNYQSKINSLTSSPDMSRSMNSNDCNNDNRHPSFFATLFCLETSSLQSVSQSSVPSELIEV